MGYNLSIGECVANVDLEERTCFLDVETIDGASLGAPIDSCGASPPTKSNACYPGYAAWHDFAERVGLTLVFFGIDRSRPWWGAAGEECECLIPNADPGVVALTPDHLDAFERALADYKSPAPTRAPDFDLVRLNWLVWWTRWALANCKYPSFARG